MFTEVPPGVQVYLTRAAFEEARADGVVGVKTDPLRLQIAADAAGHPLPTDAPASLVIGQRDEILPQPALHNTELYSQSGLPTAHAAELTINDIKDTYVVPFYTDEWTSEAASIGVAAGLQVEEVKELRTRTVTHVAVGLITAVLTGATAEFDAPLPATASIVLCGLASVIALRVNHRRDANALKARRNLAASQRPVEVIRAAQE